jgi:signal transduction histidine kinase
MSQSATDDLVHLLAHQHRREVLNALVDTSSSASIDQCLSWDLDSQDRFEECSRHLDILERANIIEYDESARTVSQGSNFDQIVPLIRAFSRTAGPHDFDQDQEKLKLVIESLQHDLLNVLNTVQARASTLAENSPGEYEHDHQTVIEERIEETVTRVETMEAFTDAVVSEGAHELRDYAIGDVLEEEVSKLQRPNTDVEIVQDGVPDVQVRGDARLSLLFENLLRNAIEHNESESPTVRVTGRCEDGLATVAIADDGPGIPDDEKQAALAEGATDGDSNGSGFGLHFVKQTVDSYGGAITISNRNPEGTIVEVTLQRGTDSSRVDTSSAATL